MKNRTLLVLAICALAAMALVGCGSAPVAAIGNATGTESGSAQGFGGEVTVTVTMANGFITEVVCKGDAESPTIGGPVLLRAPGQIIRYNSAQFDSISGATVTSMAVAEAAQAAIDKIVAGASGAASALDQEEIAEDE